MIPYSKCERLITMLTILLPLTKCDYFDFYVLSLSTNKTYMFVRTFLRSKWETHKT